MKTHISLVAACFALAATGALADHTADHCGSSVEAEGMQARVQTIRSQADRIEWTTDRVEQRKLVELNMKHLQEASVQLRKRELSPACRIELMSAMMEAMLRNQQVVLGQ